LISVICQHLVCGVTSTGADALASAFHRFACRGRIRIGLRILRCVTNVLEPATERASRGSTRSRRWERLSHGLYVPRDSRRLTLDLAAWQLVLPESACFTSLTSAELRGCWQPLSVPHPVFVSVPSPQLLYEGGSIIAGMDRLLGRLWDPRRLARWEALLRGSLLRSSGRAEVLSRWRSSP
jgi:hypothetical protein